ncbi:MAG: type VI secretion protein IcmF/TssM N-terminal domain-containing protein [Magnetovibrionaceae bacterium]
MSELLDILRPYLPLISAAAILVALIILGLLWAMISKAGKRPVAAEQMPQAPAIAGTEEQRAAEMAAGPIMAPPSALQAASDASKGSLRRSFSKALSVLKRITPGKDFEYRKPWFLMLGETGSGKTSLLDAMDLALPAGRPSILGAAGEADGKALNWWMFERGLVIDVAGDLVLRKAQGLSSPPGGDDKGFTRLIRNLQRVRPRRPFDGVVLALSVEDLLDADRAALIGPRADHLANRLHDLQRETGLSYPVHVVVTQCDKIPMFKPFFQAVAKDNRGQMFGWANPNVLEAAFDPIWVDEAFRSLDQELLATGLKVAVAAEAGKGAEAALLFPGAFQKIKEPLTTALERIFRPSAYGGGIAMRGLHFTGDLGPVHGSKPAAVTAPAPMTEATGTPSTDSLQALFQGHKAEVADEDGAADLSAREPAPRLAPASSGADLGAASDRPVPALARDLFAKRIFAETGLAKPLPGRLVSRNRSVLAAQGVLAGLIVVLGLGLALSYFSLKSDIESLVPALADVREDIQRMESDRKENDGVGDAARTAFLREYKQNSALRLLEAMAQIQTNTLGGVFMPSSWFSNVDNDVVAFISRGFDRIIMRAMVDQLETRTEALLAPTDRRSASAVAEVQANPALRGDIEAAPEYQQLRRLVEGLAELEENIDRYNSLSEDADLEVLGELTQYLFDITMPADFFSYGEFYTRAIENARQRPFEIERFRGKAVARTRDVTWTLYERLFHSGALSQNLYDLTQALRALEQPAASLEGEARAMVALATKLAETDRLLASPEWAWLSGDRLNVGLGFGQLLARVGTLSFLGPDISIELITQGQNGFEQFKRRLGAYKARLVGPILARSNNQIQLALNPRLVSLQNAINDLAAQPFMAVLVRQQMDTSLNPLQRLTWDVAGLESALRLYEAYDRFQVGALSAFPQSLQNRVLSLARDRLDNNMASLIANAQTVAGEGGWLNAPEDGLTREIRDFAQAAPRLLSLLNVLSDLNLVETYEDLQRISLAQSRDLLNRSDDLLDQEALYQPFTPINLWRGNQPVAFHAFNLGDDLEVQAYLDAMRERVRFVLKDYVEPLIGFLSDSNFRRALSGTQLATKWRRIFETISQYEKRQPGTSLGQLEKFIRFDMVEATGATCAQVIERPADRRTADFFLARMDQLQSAVFEQCKTLGVGQLANLYVELSDLFNRLLAGRYPFAAVALGEPLREAEPEDIRTFFQFFDRQEPAIRDLLKESARLGPEASRAIDFVDQLAAARAFLAPVIAADPGKVAEYPIDVAFRVNVPNEDGGNQIISWTLALPAKDLTRRTTEKTGTWREGDPIGLSLRWAKDSPRKPKAIANGSGVVEDQLTAKWSYEGKWALFRFLEIHESDPGDFASGLDPDPHTLKFIVDNARPATWLNPDLVAEGERRRSQTRVYVHVGLTSAGSKEEEPKALVRPSFPLRAPLLNVVLN